MNPYTIIDDHAYLWVAKTDDLREELERLGWTQHLRGRYIDTPWSEAGDALVEEPEAPEDAEPGAAYAELCSAVSMYAGPNEEISGSDIWAAYPGANVLTFDPASGPRAWSWDQGQPESNFPARVYRVEDGDAEDVSDDPLANPVDGEESILVIARTEWEAAWIAAECDAEATTVHQPDNKDWHGTTIVAAVRREDVLRERRASE